MNHDGIALQQSFKKPVLGDARRPRGCHDLPMLQREVGQQLHLVLGRPWREAQIVFATGSDRDLWEAPSYEAGDLLLTILDTRPRTFLCLERASRASSRSRFIHVTDAWAPPAPVFVDSVIGRLERRLPRVPGPVPEQLADDLLRALAEEVSDPTPITVREGRRCSGTSRERSSGLQAIVLARAGGVCAACERDYSQVLDGRGVAALEVHHLDALAGSPDDEVETSLERLVTVCGACHNLLHAPPQPGLLELRYAWRPSCPQCDDRQTQRTLWGMPAGPVCEDVFIGGCALPETLTQWRCAACGHEWGVDAGWSSTRWSAATSR